MDTNVVNFRLHIPQVVQGEIMFKELFKPRTLFAFMFYGVFCYLIMKQVEVPQALNSIVSSLMGYYFGQRVKKGVSNGS